MDHTKRIFVDYSGSWVNTTRLFAFLFLIAGIITSVAILLSSGGENWSQVIGSIILTLAGSVLIFLSLIVTSKILQHLLYSRKYLEYKAFNEGCEFVDGNSNR